MFIFGLLLVLLEEKLAMQFCVGPLGAKQIQVLGHVLYGCTCQQMSLIGYLTLHGHLNAVTSIYQ